MQPINISVMKNNTSNIKQNILFCTPTLLECKGLFPDKENIRAIPKSIAAELISEGELIHFINKNFMDVRLFPLQLCLAVSGALRNFLGHPVVHAGNTLFVNDGLREESIVEMMELLCKNKELSMPPYQTAIYRTSMDEAQNIDDMLVLMSLLNFVLIVLDCTLIDYTEKPQNLLVYAFVNLLLTLNKLQKITLLCFTNSLMNFEKVPAFQRKGHHSTAPSCLNFPMKKCESTCSGPRHRLMFLKLSGRSLWQKNQAIYGLEKPSTVVFFSSEIVIFNLLSLL
jgi:hypothetical protein